MSINKLIIMAAYRKSLCILLLPYALSIIICCIYLKYSANHEYECLVLNAISTVIVFAFSLAYSNTSMYDPYWFYTTFFTAIYLVSRQAVSCTNIMLIITNVLYSFKQGIFYFLFWPGFSYEDYRYKEFSKLIPNRFLYWCFSFISFHAFPTIITYIGMLPLYNCFNLFQFNLLTALGLLIGNAGWLLQGIADYQLLPWRLQKRNDCINVGLWKYSRHPNYLGEILFWAGLYIIAVGIDVNNLRYYYCPLAFIALFNLYSIPSMEKHLLLSKPVEYRKYMANTSRLIPSM